jgi:hypothetical protein
VIGEFQASRAGLDAPHQCEEIGLPRCVGLLEDVLEGVFTVCKATPGIIAKSRSVSSASMSSRRGVHSDFGGKTAG